MADIRTDDALQGNLKDFPLPLLLRTLQSKGRTGVLRIGAGSEVWVSRGQVYLAIAPSSPALDSALVAAGLTTVDQCRVMFAEANESVSVLERLLPVIGEREQVLRILLREYNLATLFELSLPSDASFVFDRDKVHRFGDYFAEDSAELLSQVGHRLSIWKRISTRIASTDVCFQLAAVLPDGAWERIVSAQEWRLLALLNGHRSVAEVILADGGSAFSVCSALYRLLLQGVIEPVGLPTQVASHSETTRPSAAEAQPKSAPGNVPESRPDSVVEGPTRSASSRIGASI